MLFRSGRGRLAKAIIGKVTASYGVNGLGQRAAKLVKGQANPDAKRYFVYDELGHLLGEYDGQGKVVQEYVWLGDQPVAVFDQGKPYFVYVDHLNAPRSVEDGTKRIVWRWDSEPFGTAAANEDPDGDGVRFAFNLRFPGQYLDAETGLHYNYFRDYDPATGRYIESDPAGLAAGLNTYAYVGSDPVGSVDPLGLAEEKCAGEVVSNSETAVVPDNPTVYSVAFEMKLDPADFGKRRSVHFNRANAALDNALKRDEQFADIMENLIPGVKSSVSSVGGRATPRKWTWEHASSSTANQQFGVMRLVPTAQHTPGSPFWRILHPNTGAAVGYTEWAIPAGAPKN